MYQFLEPLKVMIRAQGKEKELEIAAPIKI
jgi:hypothetical protein